MELHSPEYEREEYFYWQTRLNEVLPLCLLYKSRQNAGTAAHYFDEVRRLINYSRLQRQRYINAGFKLP